MLEPDIPNDLLIGQNDINKFSGFSPIMKEIPRMFNAYGF